MIFGELFQPFFEQCRKLIWKPINCLNDQFYVYTSFDLKNCTSLCLFQILYSHCAGKLVLDFCISGNRSNRYINLTYFLEEKYYIDYFNSCILLIQSSRYVFYMQVVINCFFLNNLLSSFKSISNAIVQCTSTLFLPNNQFLYFTFVIHCNLIFFLSYSLLSYSFSFSK